MGSKKGLWWLLGILVVLIVAVWVYFLTGGSFSKIADLAKKTTEKKVVSRDLATVGLQGDIMGIYPQSEDEQVTFALNRNIFEPLVTFDRNLKIVPALAEEWTNTSDTSWRFTLKKNVKFSDGKAFTADDVKFSIDQAIKNEWATSAYLGTVDSVNVVDPTTVEIKTKGPDPVLLNSLAMVFIVSKDMNADPAAAAAKPVGTGPYTFVEWVKGDHITFKSNPTYYAGEPATKQVIYKVYEDDAARVEALTSGKIDATAYYDTETTTKIQANTNLEIKTIGSLSVSSLLMNTTKETSPFKNLKVRQAVYQALDPNKIIAKLASGGQPATQLQSKIVFGYNPSIKRLTYNPTAAKQLLSEAGYPNGFDITLDDGQGVEAVDNEIAAELKAVGINVTLNIMDREKLVQKVFVEKNVDLLRASWSSDTGDAANGFATLFHTPDKEGLYGTANFGYSNKEVDALIDKAAATFSMNDRKTILQDIGTKLADDVAFVPIYVTNFNYGVSKNLAWEPRPDGSIFAFDITGSYIEE